MDFNKSAANEMGKSTDFQFNLGAYCQLNAYATSESPAFSLQKSDEIVGIFLNSEHRSTSYQPQPKNTAIPNISTQFFRIRRPCPVPRVVIPSRESDEHSLKT